MPSSASKLLTRKLKAVRRGSKTFRHNKKLRQNISAKKLYTKGKKFRGGDTVKEENSSEECPICFDYLDSNINNNSIIVTQCSHKFHTKCLQTWHITSVTNSEDASNFDVSCPLCRTSPCIDENILFPNENDEAGRLLKEAKAVASRTMEQAAEAQRAWDMEAQRAARRAALRARILRRVELLLGHGHSFKEWRDGVSELKREWGRIATRIATRTARVGRIATRIAARVGTRAARVGTRAARAVGTRTRTREVAALEE